MLHGVCRELEDEADRLLRDSLEGVTKHSEKKDLLTRWKLDERKRREVYLVNTPAVNSPSEGDREDRVDRSTRSGMFGRTYNARRRDLNSRTGIASFVRHRAQPIPRDDPGFTTLPMEWRNFTITLQDWRRL
jgi:hypothetical protein